MIRAHDYPTSKLQPASGDLALGPIELDVFFILVTPQATKDDSKKTKLTV